MCSLSVTLSSSYPLAPTGRPDPAVRTIADLERDSFALLAGWHAEREERAAEPPAASPSYVVVSSHPELGLTELRLTAEQLIAALEARGHALTGTNRNPRHRAELQGQPIFSGLLGPMYGGPGLVRYETSAANDQLSA